MTTESGRETVNLTFEQWKIALEVTFRAVEADTREAEERLRELQAQLAALQEERALLERAALAVKSRLRHVDTPRSRVPGNTMWEVLILNFADEEGIIRGAVAASRLHEIGYFANRRSADGAVYTNLRKPPFVKVEKGVYRIPTDSPEWIRLRESNGHQPQMPLATAKPKKFVKSGLGDAVADILAQHPNWDRRIVTNYLVTSGWDFRGKNPNFAVSMAFTRLAKKPKVEDMPPGRGSQSQPM